MNNRHSDGIKYCSCCLQECGVTTIDEGIGAYEYWGDKAVDIRLVEVSICCEEELLDRLPEGDKDD
jgi:hypothetical protein